MLKKGFFLFNLDIQRNTKYNVLKTISGMQMNTGDYRRVNINGMVGIKQAKDAMKNYL